LNPAFDSWAQYWPELVEENKNPQEKNVHDGEENGYCDDENHSKNVNVALRLVSLVVVREMVLFRLTQNRLLSASSEIYTAACRHFLQAE
jgi:hypothetical protein